MRPRCSVPHLCREEGRAFARRLFPALLLLALCLPVAQADILISLDSYSYSNGTWTYNYSINNTTGSYWAYGLILDNVDMATITGFPSGWNITQDISMDGGPTWMASGSGSWVPHGNSLSGFTVTSPYAPGTVAWDAYIDYDGVSGGTGTVISGETQGPVSPEPASLCLLVLAGAAPLVARYRQRRRSARSSAKAEAG